MTVRKAGLNALLTIGAVVATCGSAFAMQPVSSKEGLAAGAEVGYSFGQYPGNFAAAGDIEYGIKNPVVKTGNAAIVVDGLADFGNGFNQNVITAGLLVPLGTTSNLTYGVEGGYARDYVSVSGAGSATNSGGMLGGRVTFAQTANLTLNGMVRYYFVSGGAYQFGVGVTKPMGGLTLQADYYRVAATGSGSVASNYILVGLRFNLGS